MTHNPDAQIQFSTASVRYPDSNGYIVLYFFATFILSKQYSGVRSAFIATPPSFSRPQSDQLIDSGGPLS